MTIDVREMVRADAPAVAELSAQLGYKATPAEVTRRFMRLQQTNDGFFVGVRGAEVAGWLHVYGVRLLETDGYAEIGGLVVDIAVRRQGIGRQLVARAEAWAAAHGFGELRLRSGLRRGEAHAFYRQLGYELVKTGYMFRKGV